MEKKANPYDWMHEVTESKYFAGRRGEIEKINKELERLCGDYSISPILAVVGERRVGKTSLLFRLKNICKDRNLFGVVIKIENPIIAQHPWEFWKYVLDEIKREVISSGIVDDLDINASLGFKVRKQNVDSIKFTGIKNFDEAYGVRDKFPILTTAIIEEDLKIVSKALENMGINGMVLFIDEAHCLVGNIVITQQLRQISRDLKVGIIFSGEPELGAIFTNSKEPLYLQGSTIRLENFLEKADIAECILLPLDKNLWKLISPETVDLVSQLSRGKPNVIKLICSSIHDKFSDGSKKDLNLTIDVLEDIVDKIEASFSSISLRDQVSKIQKLDSFDLEALFNMTRYPRWTENDIVNLDEAFRGEYISDRAIARRKIMLEKKREEFIRDGVMENAGNRYVLKGDEYLYLYVRFLYEIRKFGGLRRKLDLRNLPTSLFGEKVDKIISSFSVDIEQNPDMQFTMIISHEISLADILLQIKKKFSFLSGLIKGEMNIDVKDKDYNEIFQNCFDICELVKDKGKYYLVFMLVRNLENPQEMRAVEIYYPIKKTIIVDTTILEKLQIQAQAAKMKIEGVDHFSVDLTDLNGFFDSIGQSMQKFLSILNPIQSWHISAVRHIVEDDSRKEDLVVSNDKKIDEWGKKITGYLDLYSKGDPKEAEKSITKLIDEASIERIPRILARLYNDRGYIRYDISGKESAEQDLSMALQLHYEGMTVTLMNLSVIFIDEGNYSKAIDFLEKALFLTYGRSSISAGFLRLRLPENHFNFKQKWEQKPANVLEAAYTNLAFAVLKQDGWKEAKEILDEGLSLYPSSIRLKHAIARLYLNQKHADLADPIYLDLYNTLKVVKYEDQRMVQEVEMYNNKYNKKGLRRK